jgi:glycogen debranching enzyme
MTVQIPHPSVVLHSGDIALACGLAGDVRVDEMHGLFVDDTRVLSTYRIMIGGQEWQLLGRNREGHGSATFTFQNPEMRGARGPLPAGSLYLTLRRRVAGAMHDDLTIRAYADHTIEARLTLQLDADFADVFEVKDRRLPPRLDVVRQTDREHLNLRYDRAGFRRGLEVTLITSEPKRPPTFVGPEVVFDLLLGPNEEWTCCLNAEVVLDGVRQPFVGDPHDPEPPDIPDTAPTVSCDQLLQSVFERGHSDLHALAVPYQDTPFVSAGVPWFMCLFGRDTLVSALMSGVVGDWPARGALAALSPLQATERDDWRDAEPGKIPHELRHGELAFRHLIPHTPYYGTHDAPALFCLTLWNTWRWTGDDGLLDAHFETAQLALRWCDEHGDRDGDGLQEYETRSDVGYYNQSWKDASDAIIYPSGDNAKLPIATVELQGYLYAARLAMAELSEWRGDRGEAARLREDAATLRDIVEQRFWMADEGFYAMALDGDKEQVVSIGSNPGQLLWCGVANSSRARRTTKRMLADDMFSGFGLRTLSAKHARYNPLSYQRGSVWPHDTLLTAAGMVRYGLRNEAATLIRGVLDAACALEDSRLPELFCGIERELGGPVPYAEANIPQAWAAAAAPLAVQLFLGIVPDAPNGRLYLDPWLPEWLDRLQIDRLAVGGDSVRIVVVRNGTETSIEEVEAKHLEVVVEAPEAALWGRIA